MNDHELEDLLKNADRSAVPVDLAVEGLADTVRERHAAGRRRRDRRLRAALFVGCYCAGVLSMWFWTHAGERKEAADDTRGVTNVAAKSVPEINGKSGPPVARREIRAEQPAAVVDVDSETPYEQYRRLGDVALMEDRSVDVAVEFYRRALAAATKSERDIAIDEDSWVMIQLKQGQLNAAL